MVYNLTDKLQFDADPVIRIRDVELTVKAGAEDVLKLIDGLEKLETLDDVKAAGEFLKCEPILFAEEDRKKLKGLGLKMPDYMKVLQTAISLATGQDPDEAEEKNE